MKNHQFKINIFIQVLVVLLISIGQLRSQNQITGYTYAGSYGGHVYYLSDCTSNWYNANTAAGEMGGYLVTIADMDENSFIQSLVSGDGAWIGFSIPNSGWVNGEPFIFDNVSYYYLGDSMWDDFGFGFIYSNGAWAIYNGYIPHPFIVEFDTNPDCNNPNKTYVCHNGNTICVGNEALQGHLDHGDFAGPCGPCNTYGMQTLPDEILVTEDPSLQPEKVTHSESKEELEVLQKMSASNQIQVFPNPASELINVTFPDDFHEGSLRILSSTGQEILAIALHGQQSMMIDLSTYTAGIYLIDVQCANGHYHKKFVKL